MEKEIKGKGENCPGMQEKSIKMMQFVTSSQLRKM
jgi:hypothetical protein